METATEAPEVPVTFMERVKGLNRKQLTEIATEEFQLNIDSTVKQDTLRDTLIRVHEERITSAMEQNQAAAQIFLLRDSDEVLLNVTFRVHDFPNNPLKFSNDCGYGVRDRKDPKRNPTGLSKMPKFFLIPGQSYYLPLCLINILEKLTYRDGEAQKDRETGMVSGTKPIIKQRFTFVPVLDQDTLRGLGTREFK